METDMAVDTNGGEGPRRREATTVFPHITARTAISILPLAVLYFALRETTCCEILPRWQWASRYEPGWCVKGQLSWNSLNHILMPKPYQLGGMSRRKIVYYCNTLCKFLEEHTDRLDVCLS
jgi:hypothetical protein